MTQADVVLLGMLQGATEFLPVSSSGHLRLAEAALQAKPPSILFDIALHVGTLVATVAFFRADILAILAGLRPRLPVPWRQRESVRVLGLMLLASVPTAVLGLALEPAVGGDFAIWAVGALLVVNGAILLATRRIRHRPEPDQRVWGISPWVALLIGLAQGVAVLPGISRSGATIATAMLCGVRWRPATVFSFLLSIPAILGALALKLGDVGAFSEAGLGNLILGVVVALVVGLVCLGLLVRAVRTARLHLFAWYCFAVGLLGLVFGLRLL